MINSISSMSSVTSLMRSNSMQRQQPPPEKNIFQAADTDNDGIVSGTELETLVKGIEEVTGNTIDQDTLSSFDADGDGGLNGEELLGLMQSNGFSFPEMITEESEEMGMRPPPPPPPSSEQAISSYAQNTGDDMITQLMNILQNGTEDNSTGITSIDVTT